MVGGAIESLDTGCGRGYWSIRHRMWEGLLKHCTQDVGGAHEWEWLLIHDSN